MKRIFKVFTLCGTIGCFLFPCIVSASGLSVIEKGIYQLELAGLRLSAVHIEMESVLKEYSAGGAEYQKRVQKALEDLNKIKSDLRGFDLPQPLNELRLELDNILEQWQTVYAGSEKKRDGKSEETYNSLLKKSAAYNKDLESFINDNIILPELPKNFNIESRERSMLDTRDRPVFDRITRAMTERKYRIAHNQLKSLLKKYKGTAFEGSIISRMVDCRERVEEFIEGRTPDKSIELLNKFIESTAYSPRLYKIFEQWRTLDQSFNYGMSNWSVIPNQDYINERWFVIKNIEKHLKDDPEDIWARWQITTLMNLPIIQRTGLLGNTNLNHWYRLSIENML